MDLDPPAPKAAPDPIMELAYERLRVLSEVTQDIAWHWDLRVNRVLYNAAFITALGEPPEDYYEAHAWWRSKVHPDDLERIARIYDEAFKEGRTRLSYEYRILNRNGQYLYLDSRVSLVRDAAGDYLSVLVASRDISERKRAEFDQVRLNRIIEATPDFVGLAAASGELTYINAAGRKMLGLPDDEMVRLHLAQIHPEWANEIVLKEALPSAVRQGLWQGESALLPTKGPEIPVSQTVLSHMGADGAVEFFSTIMRDLSDRKRDEVTRIEWANRYDAAIRASGQVLFDWNSFTNEITYAGDTAQLVGYSIAELEGGLDRFRELIHPEDLQLFDDEVRRINTTRDPFNLQFRLMHKNGTNFYVESKGYFFLDRRGQIGRMVGFLADITDQRRAQAALAVAHGSLEQRVAERTAELAQASSVIVDRARQQEAVAQLGQRALAGGALNVLFDQAMVIVRDILHVDCCSLLALTVDGSEFVTRAQSGWPDPHFGNRVPTGHRSQSGYTLLTAGPVIVNDFNTERRFVPSAAVAAADLTSSVSVLIEGDEKPLGVVAAFTRKARIFVQDDVHFLQSVANVLTAAIQRQRAEENARQAREQAEMASRAKSEFLSRMSHELRTPLNAILGFTQLLELEATTPSQNESIQHISKAGKNLLALINEVLDISRVEAGRLAMHPEPIELLDFLRLALDAIRPLAERSKVELTLEPSQASPPHTILADRHRLQQVILNLLSNAVKYNRAGGQVTVSYRDAGPRLRITVADTGSGIAPEKLARLFLPFERLGAESTEIEGSGIGLALSRGIVTALNGELNVESRVGEGSTFWVTLPRAEPAASFEPPAAIEAVEGVRPPPGIGNPRTLLYIEDQDLNLRLVERILGSRPQYRLLKAMKGEQGLQIAREHRPDLILLDLNLPDISGDEVLRQLKEDPAVSPIPVIMVSADAMGERIASLLSLGASGYLTKPYKVSEFLRSIEQALAGAAS